MYYTSTGDGGFDSELLQGTIPSEWDKLADPLSTLELNGNNLTGTHAILLLLYIIFISLLDPSTNRNLFVLRSQFCTQQSCTSMTTCTPYSITAQVK